MVKKVLLTGQSGLGKTEFLKKAKTYFGETSYRYESVGKWMVKSYKYKAGINEERILNLQMDMLEQLHYTALEEIKSIIEKLEAERVDQECYFILNGHGFFRWKTGLFLAGDLEEYLEYNPDIVICLIDDIVDVKKGLMDRGTYYLDFWELFSWREEEIWLSKLIANANKRINKKETSFFILPKAEGPEFFSNLITKPQSTKVYMSFPITNVRKEEKNEIEIFKNRIREKLIAFDPYSIKDGALVAKYNTSEDEIIEKFSEVTKVLKKQLPQKNKIWEPFFDYLTPLSLVKFKISGTEITGRELLSVSKTIHAQIISRDYMLIDQSDIIVMYIKDKPNGNPDISAGCQSELMYGNNHGKPVYVIYSGGRQRLSPFITVAAKVFRTTNEALEFILKKYESTETE